MSMSRRKYKRRGERHEQDPSFLELLAALFRLFVRLLKWAFGGRKAAAAPAPAPVPELKEVAGRQPIPAIWRSGLARPGALVAPALADAVQPGEALPYRRQRRLLSKGEWAFWHPLYQAVKGKYRIFAKVRLADVICCASGRRDERRWFRKIGSYHVDFVIADPETTAPLLVIELDDRGHQKARQRELDRFKDEACRTAGMPVYRVPSQQAYDPEELAREIQRRIRSEDGRP
jgi:hypothetical protein